MATTKPLPDIGATGLYQLAAPFAALLIPNAMYTCRAIKRFSEVSSLGVDPFETYYEPHGLTEAKYKADDKEAACIVSLQAGSGNWIYVPSTYIQAFPSTNGVKYNVTILGVSLGGIPDNLNLTPLQTLISDTVYGSLGIRPSFKTVVVSDPAMVNNEDHLKLEEARLANITITEPLAVKVYKLQQEKAVLATKLAAAEQWIKDHI